MLLSEREFPYRKVRIRSSVGHRATVRLSSVARGSSRGPGRDIGHAVSARDCLLGESALQDESYFQSYLNRDRLALIVDPDPKLCEALSVLFRLEGFQTAFAIDIAGFLTFL